MTVKTCEVLARRYCALLGEDPDETIEGLPVWKIALADLEAAITALETFGVNARAPMSDTEYASTDAFNTTPRSPRPPKLRCVA